MKLRAFYPYTVDIDGEPVRLLLKSMQWHEANEFMKKWERLTNPTQERFYYRKPSEQSLTWVCVCKDADCSFYQRHDEESAARDAAGAHQSETGHHVTRRSGFTIPDREVKDRRLAEMDDETRVRFAQAQKEDEAFAEEFIPEAFERYVSVASELEAEVVDPKTGKVKKIDIESGGDFLNVIGARRRLWMNILTVLQAKNELGDWEKKASPSRSDSSDSSKPHKRAPSGQRQEMIVEPAELEGSLRIEDATESETSMSGSTIGSESKRAPSAS